jgi:hypothetical protein
MKSTQAWGWLVAGVLAMGLNGIYHDGGAAYAARSLKHALAPIVGRSGAVLALASGRADWFLAKAQEAGAREETASCRLSTAMARWQAKRAQPEERLAQIEAASARRDGQLARRQAGRDRVEAEVSRVRLLPAVFETVKIPGVCPRVHANVPRVRIPAVPAVD